MLDKFRFEPEERENLVNSMVILVDTREKKNDHIISLFNKYNIAYKPYKLDFGDYSCMVPANPSLGIERDLYFDKEIVIERKANLEELSQNLTKYRANFIKELALAPLHKLVLIESHSYSDLVHGFYETNYTPKSYLSCIHTFWHKYDCPFFFLKDGRDSALFIHHHLQTYIESLCNTENKHGQS